MITLRIDHIVLILLKSVVCEIVDVKVLMRKRALDESLEKVVLSSRLAGVQRDVVHG